MIFRVEISLGNDAMQSPGDVEHAVRLSLTRKMDHASMHTPLAVGDEQPIIDRNGNTVGRWLVQV